jgi:thioredoxin reductase/bacterioferritin-associated ferredoxin
MIKHYDIAVIGAGPAGIAAATLSDQQGASVVLLDEQQIPGGQIYRNITRQSAADTSILGSDYYHGKKLTDRLASSAVDHVAGAVVWHVSETGEIGVTADGIARLIHADHIVIANGAQERPFPIKGWTLPGVMNAGAAQILLKSSGVLLPGAVFIGTGPLLYLIAHQYLRAGVEIAAVLDTTPSENIRAAIRFLPLAYKQTGQIFKGWRWLRDLRKSGTLFVSGVEEVNITGNEVAEGVNYKIKGAWKHMAATTVLLHQGVVPNANLAMAAGCAHQWSDSQLCWHAQCDDWGQSSVDCISIAGDGAGINGALAAEASGALAALAALHRIDKIDTDTRKQLAKPMQRSLADQTYFRQFLDALYRPAAQFRIPTDDSTLVCRCEEVTAFDIRKAVRLGCQGPNQLKSFTRAGMGPCQGRFCGLTISAMIADELKLTVQEVGAARLRAPVKPLELGQLAALSDSE